MIKAKTLILTTVVISIATVCLVSCSKQGVSNKAFIEDIPTIQKFKDEEIPDADIEKILKAGINSQSGMNQQPWHFTVITNKEILTDLGSKLKIMMSGFGKKGPSDKNKKAFEEGKGRPDMKENGHRLPPEGMPAPDMKDMKNPPEGFPPQFAAKAGLGDSPIAILISAKDGADFDAGLATQMMVVEAVMLGYGTKIISSPNIILNGPEKDQFKQMLCIPEDMSSKAIILIGKYSQEESDAVTGATPRKPATEVVSYVR